MAADAHPQPPHALIVGYGDLGQAIAANLTRDGWKISGLRRSEHSPNDHARLIYGDVTRPDTLISLGTLNPDILVYCVAAAAQSDDSYRAHYVDGLRHVLAALEHATHLRQVFFISSTRVYGQEGEALLDESAPPRPADFGGERLLQAEQLLAGLRYGHTALRLSGPYGPGRLRMIRLAHDPAQWPAPNTWSNRIHRDDAAAFVVFLAQRAIHGLPVEDCYIVTDDSPAPQHDVLRWLAAQMELSAPATPAPTAAGGKRLSNARMRASGFRCTYPDYRAGYAALLPDTPP